MQWGSKARLCGRMVSFCAWAAPQYAAVSAFSKIRRATSWLGCSKAGGAHTLARASAAITRASAASVASCKARCVCRFRHRMCYRPGKMQVFTCGPPWHTLLPGPDAAVAQPHSLMGCHTRCDTPPDRSHACKHTTHAPPTLERASARSSASARCCDAASSEVRAATCGKRGRARVSV